MVDEAMEALAVRPEGVYVDATFGRGGHARALLHRLGPGGRLLAGDRDEEAVSEARRLAAADSRVSVFHAPFSRLAEAAAEAGVHGGVSGILLDLGVSSPQLDDPGRGFSFYHDGPLDMRMDARAEPDAATWLARAPEREIAEVIRRYGEDRHARRIARAIVAERARAPISTTARLADVVRAAVPSREPGKHPATRTFQAIRIHVNDELGELRAALPQALALLAPEGRLVVISFHSLEDRIVKRFIRDQARGDPHPPEMPVRAAELHPTLAPVGRPRHPSPGETAANPRARSAVMRVARRLPE